LGFNVDTEGCTGCGTILGEACVGPDAGAGVTLAFCDAGLGPDPWIASNFERSIFSITIFLGCKAYKLSACSGGDGRFSDFDVAATTFEDCRTSGGCWIFTAGVGGL